jgi:hypothetical protein
MLGYLYSWIISDVTLFNSLCSGYTPYQYAASAETFTPLTPVQLTQVPVDHILSMYRSLEDYVHSYHFQLKSKSIAIKVVPPDNFLANFRK